MDILNLCVVPDYYCIPRCPLLLPESHPSDSPARKDSESPLVSLWLVPRRLDPIVVSSSSYHLNYNSVRLYSVRLCPHAYIVRTRMRSLGVLVAAG